MTSIALLREIDRLTAAGRLRDAANLLERALHSGIADSHLLRALGRVYLLQERPHDAIRIFAEAEKTEGRRSSGGRRRIRDDVTDDDLEYLQERERESVGVKPTFDQQLAEFVRRASTHVNAPYDHDAPHHWTRLISDGPGNRSGSGDASVDRLETIHSIVDGGLPPEEVELDDVLISDLRLPEVEKAETTETPTNDFIEEDIPLDDGVLDTLGESAEPADIQKHLYDLDDLADPLPQPVQPLPSGIGREQRALQVAADFIVMSGWRHSSLDALQSFFVSYGWGAARRALQLAVGRGLTEGDFPPALYAREWWSQNEQYSTIFLEPSRATSRYRSLSWNLAAAVVKAIGDQPGDEEIEGFLEREFETWYFSDSLRRHFLAFIKYVQYRVDTGIGTISPLWPMNFSEPRADDYDDASDIGLTDFEDIERRDILVGLGLRVACDINGSSWRYSGDPEVLAAIASGDLDAAAKLLGVRSNER